MAEERTGEEPTEGHGEEAPEAHPPMDRGFRRRRPPSAQATRLMLVSLVAALALAAVLSYVFLPKLLEFSGRPQAPYYELGRESLDGTARITVVLASEPRALDAFDIGLIVEAPDEDTRIVQTPLGTPDPAGAIAFVDANGDGILNVGDYFDVTVEPGATHTLLILPKGGAVEEGGVGGLRWTA